MPPEIGKRFLFKIEYLYTYNELESTYIERFRGIKEN